MKRREEKRRGDYDYEDEDEDDQDMRAFRERGFPL